MFRGIPEACFSFFLGQIHISFFINCYSFSFSSSNTAFKSSDLCLWKIQSINAVQLYYREARLPCLSVQTFKKKEVTINFCDANSCLYFVKLSFSYSLPRICCAMCCVPDSLRTICGPLICLYLQSFCFIET